MIIKENDKKKWGSALNILQNGGVAVCPAFTIYGFSSNLFNKHANLKIFSIKRRSSDNPFIIIAHREFIVSQAVDVDLDILNFLLDNAITVIFKTKNPLPFYASKNRESAFRLSNTHFLKYITRRFPITSTSINKTGKKQMDTITKICRQYSHFSDIIINGNIKNEPSTIVRIERDKIYILRKGYNMIKLRGIL